MPDVKPADQYKEFSEIRARQILNQITDLGPRPSGSEALEVNNTNTLIILIAEFTHHRSMQFELSLTK
jgi:hypothetical protein